MTGDRLTVRTYTRARRHQILVGDIAGIRIKAAAWWQFAAFLAVGLAVFALWPLWAPLPLHFKAFVLAGPPFAFWASGKVRPDGVQPFAAVYGFCRYQAGRNLHAGHGHRDRQPVRIRIRIPVLTAHEETQ